MGTSEMALGSMAQGHPSLDLSLWSTGPQSASPSRFSLGLSSPLGTDPSLSQGHPIPVRQRPLGTDWMEEASLHEPVTLLSTMASIPQFPGEGVKLGGHRPE